VVSWISSIGGYLPLEVVPVVTNVKAAPTASLPEACRVAMSSNSLVVFGSEGLPGHMYVPWKLPVKTSHRSSQQLMAFLDKWSSHGQTDLAK
jgi:hypothetical protein